MTRQYLAVRTDRDNQKFVMGELDQGRLRQGWGYAPCQDLRLIKKKRKTGKSLNDDEAEAWPNRRLLETETDGVKPGDVLVLPNLPKDGRWVLARVAGRYDFSISTSSSDAGKDYGHIVPVEPIRDGKGLIAALDPYNEFVDARLRSSMKCQSRIWSLDVYAAEVERLMSAVEAGGDTATPEPDAKKVSGIFDAVRDAAWRGIVKRYQGAEFEKLVHQLFQRIYAGGRVEHRGGPSEHGADLIVFTQDPLGLEYKVAVQVKLHDGVDHDTTALEQIREARKVHRVDAGVVVTTAERTSEAFEQQRVELEGDLGIDVRAITRDEFVHLVLAHMSSGQL